jgi:hypothetical protein
MKRPDFILEDVYKETPWLYLGECLQGIALILSWRMSIRKHPDFILEDIYKETPWFYLGECLQGIAQILSWRMSTRKRPDFILEDVWKEMFKKYVNLISALNSSCLIREVKAPPKLLGYFDSRHYQIFWEVEGLERGTLSLASATEELPKRESSGSCLEKQRYGCRDPLHWSRDTLYPQKLVLPSPTSGGHSVVVVRSRTKATELLVIYTYQLSTNR